MKTLVRRFCMTMFVIAYCIGITAKQYNADNLPLPKNSAHPNYVCNPDNILSDTTMVSINAVLLNLEKEKGVKSLIIVVRNIDGDDPYQLAIDVGNKYGVGSKQNTGFIVVLATDDRSYYILTGEGLEKFLPDAICKRIENRVMVPYLKNGEWDNAIYHTVSAISDVLHGESELTDESEEEDDTIPLIISLSIIAGGGLLIIFALIFSLWQEKKCPKCKRHKAKQTKTEVVKQNGKRITTKTYVCEKCGYTFKRQRTETDYDEGYHGTGGGFFIGGLGGGRSGGGGASFGSFGGGSFGGGGAGGRF